jgi:hypothetical protein
VLAEGGLEARHGRTANAQNGGGLFKGGSEQSRQQHRLTLSQGLDRGGDGSGQLRPLNNKWINPAWSCHAETLPLFGSSWKRIRISCEGANGPSVCLNAPAAFQSGTWYLLTLAYSETNSALYVNGQQVAAGSGLATVPPEFGLTTSLVLGSSLGGGAVACGQVEAFTAFTSRPRYRHEPVFEPGCSVAEYYAAYSGLAALGPINDARLAGQRQTRAQALTVGAAATSSLSSTQTAAPTPLDSTSGCCGTNSIYEVWLTNIMAWPGEEAGWNTALSIAGGTNGALYDLYRTTALAGEFLTNSAWVWLTNAYACDTVLLANEPESAFYILGTPLDSDGDGISDAYSAMVQDGLGPDSNGNGVPDWLEVAMGYDPRQTNDLGKTKPDYSLFLASPPGASQIP